MALKDHFKWYASVAKDAALNVGDAVITTLKIAKAHNNTQQGNPEEAMREVDEFLASVDARKAARNARKPPKPGSGSASGSGSGSASFLTV